MLVRHECDNPPCCNPRHLLDGTAEDNSADMKARGRSKTRLTVTEIEAIRQAEGTQREIAQRFGVTRGYVGHLRRGVRRNERKDPR